MLGLYTNSVTFAVPATVVDHALSTSSPTPVSASPGQIPFPYKNKNSFVDGRTAYNARVGSPLQVQVATGYSLSAKQWSVLDFVALCATIYSAVLMAWRIVILTGGVRHVVKLITTMPGYVNQSFRHRGCRAGYFGLVMAWFAWLGEYWTTWSGGYMTFQTALYYLIVYLVGILAYAKRRFIKHAALMCLPWIARQVTNWYDNRMNKKRIDKIFERPISKISITECLFPDIVLAAPHNPTISQGIWALLKDISFFAWNLLILVVKCRIRSWQKIPSHTRDVLRVTGEILLGIGGDDTSWTVWLAGYVIFLKSIRLSINMIFSTTYRLIAMSLGVVWILLQLAIAIINRLLWKLEARKSKEMKIREIKTQNDRMNNARIKVAHMTWQETAEMYLKLQDAKEDLTKAPAAIEETKANYASRNSVELGKKCVAYRRSLRSQISDNNYFRRLICAILNAHHNIVNNRSPTAADAPRPYKPSYIFFHETPDPKTGLYILNGKAHIFNPFQMDPFAEDPYTIAYIMKGVQLPSWPLDNNPFKTSQKDLSPTANPELASGLDAIEDWAADGRLPHWKGGSDLPIMREEPFRTSEIREFVRDMAFGTESLVRHRPAPTPVAPPAAAPLRAAKSVRWALPDNSDPAWLRDRPPPSPRNLFS